MDIQRLRDIFDRENNFGIIVGSNYTIDEMGGALALYLTLTSMGKSASIISSKEPLVEVSNLVGIDRVKTSFEGAGGDLIVSFPYKGDEIGKDIDEMEKDIDEIQEDEVEDDKHDNATMKTLTEIQTNLVKLMGDIETLKQEKR